MGTHFSGPVRVGRSRVTAISGTGLIAPEAIPEALIRTASGTLTNAQIKALLATPVTVIPAPGAGLAIVFLGGALFLDYGTNALTETDDNLVLRYQNATGAACSQTIEATGFVTATTDTMTSVVPTINAIAARSACENQPIVIHNTGDANIAGNAANDTVIRFYLRFAVVPTGW